MPRPFPPFTTNAPLGPGAEFDMVRELRAVWGERAQGIGDDAALVALPKGHELVVSTDTSVDRVHFRRDWLTPREIGYRATTAALSDLAAMAARPIGIVLALVIPDAWRSAMRDIAAGIGEACAGNDAHIIGGDLSRGSECSIGVTVLGSVRRPLLRSAARAGDVLYVTGRLGGPGAALDALRAGAEPVAEHRQRFATPSARTREAQWLASQGAGSAIDISDGLIADARHLAAASGVTLAIDLDRVPCVAGSDVEEAARSGEEYELLVAAPEEADLASFEGNFGIPLTAIGTVHAPGDADVMVSRRGRRVEIAGGYDHFSS